MTDRRVVDLAAAHDAAAELVRELRSDAPALSEDANGVVALRGGRAVALVSWGAFPGFDGVTEVYLGLMARAGVDGAELAGPLLAAAIPRLSARPCRAWMHVEDAQSYLQDVLQEHGFAHRFTSCHYEGPLPLPAPTARAVAHLVTYRGGDPAVDAAMEDLHRRGFRDRVGVPEWAGPSAESPRSHVLAYDGDRLAGFVTWIPTAEVALFENVVLERRYRGSGLAHTLACAMSDAAVAAGCTTLHGYVHATNHPSRGLGERLGLRVTGEVRAFLRELPA